MENTNIKVDDKSELHHQFLIEEYKALRQEIDNNLLQLRRIIYLNILGCGALWYFILDSLSEKKPLYLIIYWLPLMLCTLCGLYFISLRRDVKRIGSYLKDTENEFLKKGNQLGWENFLINISKSWFGHTDKFETFHWIVLLVLNFFGAMFFTI